MAEQPTGQKKGKLFLYAVPVKWTERRYVYIKAESVGAARAKAHLGDWDEGSDPEVGPVTVVGKVTKICEVTP